MELDGLWTISFKAVREQHAGLTLEEEVQRGGILVIAGGKPAVQRRDRRLFTEVPAIVVAGFHLVERVGLLEEVA